MFIGLEFAINYYFCKYTLATINIKLMAKNTAIKMQEVATYIVDWLKNYANNARVNGFIVRVSGGIDSAVTSTLCAQTGLKTICVEMPIHQAESQVNRAKEHIAYLKNNFSNVDSAGPNSKVINWYGGDVTLCSEKEIKNIINSMLK